MTVAADRQPPSGARPERSGVSVRVRITAAVALLTPLALSGAGLIVYVIEAQRIDQDISQRVDQQFGSSRRSRTPTARRTRPWGPCSTRSSPSQVPDDNEALVTWYDAGAAPASRSMSPRTATPVRTRRLRAAAATIAEDNGTARLDDPEDELILNAQTVQRPARPAH